MNKPAFLLILLSIITGFAISAADKAPENYHMKGILTDGTEIEGYNKTLFQNFMQPWVTKVKLSDTFDGPETTYTSDELKSVWFTKLGDDSIPVIYQSVMAQKRLPHLLNKNPKPYKNPVFLRLIYNGENVKGYIRPYADFSHAKTMSTANFTYIFYYLTKDSDVAVAYWDGTSDIVPSMRKVMKFFLREFPELVRMIDDGELTPEMFRENPAIVLPLMDKSYRPKQ